MIDRSMPMLVQAGVVPEERAADPGEGGDPRLVHHLHGAPGRGHQGVLTVLTIELTRAN